MGKNVYRMRRSGKESGRLSDVYSDNVANVSRMTLTAEIDFVAEVIAVTQGGYSDQYPPAPRSATTSLK